MYGGMGRQNKKPITAEKVKAASKNATKEATGYELECYLPPLSVVVLQYDYKD